MIRDIQVYYNPQMLAASGSTFSPSSVKPGLFVNALRQSGLPHRVVTSTPMSLDDIRRVHDPEFVDGVMAGKVRNGFGSQSLELARSLPFTSGSLYDAARAALKEGITCSPTSGFHHAHYNFGSGFCTFNGLMASANKLLKFGLVEKAAIIDADFHYGDGTNNIIDVLGLRDRVYHYSFGFDYRTPEDASRYLDRMKREREVIEKFNPGIIFYQAGADAHREDPLGGVLSTDEMRQRDRMMFETAHSLGIPLVWNLAGGYKRDAQGGIPDVLGLHLQTFEEAVKVYRDNSSSSH